VEVQPEKVDGLWFNTSTKGTFICQSTSSGL